jgi:hypothetical protein
MSAKVIFLQNVFCKFECKDLYIQCQSDAISPTRRKGDVAGGRFWIRHQGGANLPPNHWILMATFLFRQRATTETQPAVQVLPFEKHNVFASATA